MQTKKCKHCQSEIDKKARICPVCKKKQKGKTGLIIFTVLILLIIIAAVNGGKDDDTKTTTTDSTGDKVTEKPIEYVAYDVSEMMNDLNSNAMKAEKKYTDQYVEITGRLSTIDSDGKYISLISLDDEYAFIGVMCYIKSDDQTNKVMEMSADDKVTLKGKITSVGEVLGYSLDIKEIN